MRLLVITIAVALVGCGSNSVGDTLPAAPKTTRDYTVATIPMGKTYYTCCAFRSVESHVWLSPFAPVTDFYIPSMYRIWRDAAGVRLDFLIASYPPQYEGYPDAYFIERGYLRVTEIYR